MEAAAEELQKFGEELDKQEVELGVATSRATKRVKAQAVSAQETAFLLLKQKIDLILGVIV